MKNALIIGGTGLLGKALINSVSDNFQIAATYYPTSLLIPTEKCEFFYLDILDKNGIFDLFEKLRPEIVIHAAGLTSVDYCERHKKESWKVNVCGTQNILLACKKYKAKIIYISSNAVFDGKNAPYREEDKINPVNYYGMEKAECEKLTSGSRIDYAIVRPILMYGWNNKNERSNPVTWLLDSLEKGKEIKMVDDVYSNPLLSKNCAEAIWAIIKLNRSGIYHIAGRDCISRYDFAIETARVFELEEKLIRPVKSTFFKNIAPRPRNTCYVTMKMEKDIGLKPDGIKEGLLYMKDNRD